MERATEEFTVGGKTYPKGSFVVKTDQAFRPHVLDLFEPQGISILRANRWRADQL